VVGAGPAGLAFANIAAGRGHHVTLYDAASEIGGQFNLARKIPGKEEFDETVRYFGRMMIEVHGIELKLGTRVDADALSAGGFDETVVATGITPRVPVLEGIDRANVVSYIDVITGKAEVGRRVAIMGAGGIGFDVAEFITHSGTSASLDIDVFAKEWGIDFKNHPRGEVGGHCARGRRERARGVAAAAQDQALWVRGCGRSDRLDAPPDLAAARCADAGRG